MLYDLTIKEFTEVLASSSPAPGGGSVSALAGALSAALASMVASLTAGKKGYEQHDGKMREIAAKMPLKYGELIEAIEEDSKSFDGVLAAFKLPKTTDEEKAARKNAIEKATMHAANVPLSTAEKASALFDDLDFLAKNGNKNALSDVAVAAMMARSATLGALSNVEINIASLSESDYKSRLIKRVTQLRQQANAREKTILDALTV